MFEIMFKLSDTSDFILFYKQYNENVNEEDQSLKYPPGFTPNAEENDRNVNGDKSQKCNTKEVLAGRNGDSTNRGSKGDASESVCTGRFKKSEVPRSIDGSSMNFLSLNIQGLAQKAKKDWVRELCVNNKVNFLAIQETKMENMEFRCDPNSFRKSNYTISDFFVIIRGVWLKNGIDLLIIAVYAPHDPRDKRMLWDYLVHTINQWDGEVVIMGDFNEVRHKSDRFGSIFNAQGADEFNSFIANAGLEELKIREWIKSNRHSRKGMREKYKEELRTLEDDIDNGNGSDTVVNKRMEVINDLQHIDKLNAMDMAQKTKIKWSVEGDENSRFFHGMLNKKRNQLNIRGVMVDGVWNEKPHDVKREFFQHFSKRFDKPMEHRAIVDMCYPRSLLIDQQEDLERVVTKEEVKRAVWDCGTDKSPGPDGFTFGFYRQFWMTIENDVFEAVSHFFTHADIPKGCNPSFIALISKIPDANMVSDFRPISLIGSIYKIIAKILANRLVRVLWDIVNEVQSDFIAERQILDGPFILNEVLQWCKIKKNQSLIFKVDFEKAYDSVRWDFLDDVLKKSGFGNKWCDWIQTCLKSSRGSILINGSPTEEFQFCKGLKQGDPLSPFLFILIMESLHLSFQRVVDAGLFMGIKLSHSVNLSHMFYADDAVFVGQWSDRNINTLIHVLDCFYRASGLRMNMRKSKIMGVHVEGGKVKHAASKLGCLILNTPFSYLGSKVGGSMSRVQAWKEVIDKVKSRLSKWKMKALSIGGRLTLLKSVLGSIPIFHMSIFRVPSSVLHTLESIRSHFFNGHEVGSNKATWVKWNSVLTAKDSGGLGVSSLYALNRGLMMKWVWRFYNQKTSLWANVIKAIHGEDGSMGKAKYVGVRTCWTTIVNEIRVLSDQGVNVLEFMRLKLGNGDMASFWNDNWSGGGVLKDLYPRLYALENGKSVNVCTKLSDPSMDYSFRRKTRGGAEQVQLDALLELVSTVNLVPMGDRWVWTLESSGEFSVASLRKVIDEKRLPSVCSKTRWVKYVPIKVNVLAWKIKMDVLPTRLNISRRGIDIHSISCPICDCGVESSEHLFFRCKLTRQIARKISLWWNVNYEDVNSYDEWITWMVSLRLAAKSKLMFEGVFYAMWWNIWIYRNKLLFEDKAHLKAIIFDNVVSSSFYWCRDNGFVAGQAALKAESSKVAKHEKACLENQHVFIPFAFDTFGFLAPEAEEFLNRVQRVVQSNFSTPKTQNFIFSRIGFAIQKGVAAQLVARLPAILL
ncbi:RNA-directed DNA polymerase, eukaryota, reverse transcriptase zinc-binding domain protein [Tanacetum coccineum]